VVARKQATTANVDVGMMAGHLGRCGDLVDEHHRPGEVGTHGGLGELLAAPLPARQALQALGDRGVIQPWHGSSFPENERCDLRPPYGN
jgi:hypothetical protein